MKNIVSKNKKIQDKDLGLFLEYSQLALLTIYWKYSLNNINIE